MSRTALLAAAATAIALFGAPALSFAQDREHRVVTLGELDLNSDRGADTAIRRIQQASDAVCGVHSGTQSVREAQRRDECSVETADLAVSDVAHPNVTGRYYGYTPNIQIDADAGYITADVNNDGYAESAYVDTNGDGYADTIVTRK